MLLCLNEWLRLHNDKRGVSALEYGLLCAGIVAAIIVTVIAMGQTVEATLYRTVAASL